MHKQDKVFIFCAQAVHHKEKIGKMNIGLMILVNFIYKEQIHFSSQIKTDTSWKLTGQKLSRHC